MKKETRITEINYIGKIKVIAGCIPSPYRYEIFSPSPLNESEFIIIEDVEEPTIEITESELRTVLNKRGDTFISTEFLVDELFGDNKFEEE